MRLVADLKQRLDGEESYFRQHLLREDIARLEKVAAFALAHPESGPFLAAASKIGWTPDDRRTFELKETLEPLLRAIHDRALADQGDSRLEEIDEAIIALWQAFEQHRMDRLVGCLARVPRPDYAGGA
jgi:hypothetical protein